MKFYDALKYLLTTAGGTKIARHSWSSNKYLIKSKIVVGSGEDKKSIPSIDFVEVLGGVIHKTTFHANPETMISEDWYIVNDTEN